MYYVLEQLEANFPMEKIRNRINVRAHDGGYNTLTEARKRGRAILKQHPSHAIIIADYVMGKPFSASNIAGFMQYTDGRRYYPNDGYLARLNTGYAYNSIANQQTAISGFVAVDGSIKITFKAANEKTREYLKKKRGY